MKKILILIVLIMAIVLFSGCMEQRPTIGKIGDKPIENNQLNNKPYLIEKIGNNSYRIISSTDKGSAYSVNFPDTMTLGYMDIDSKCDIKFVTGIVGDDGRAYSGSSTLELIVKTDNCSYNP